MSGLTLDRVAHWTRGAGLVALAALGWALFVPRGVFGTAVLAGGLICAAIATAVLVRSRPIPTLAALIRETAAKPALVPSRSGNKGGARLRPRGERRP
jgi:hypothetical protein